MLRTSGCMRARQCKYLTPNPNMNGHRLSVGSGLVVSSQVRKNTLEPLWDEEFRLLVRDPTKQQLEVDLYDWDRFNADDHIGRSVRSITRCTGCLPLLLLTLCWLAFISCIGCTVVGMHHCSAFEDCFY